MFKEKELKSYFSKFNYDIRVLRNARWIDQKCTPDVICIIADCIINYVEQNKQSGFSTKQIWDFKYSIEISNLFSKPAINSPKVKNEYDKFFQQPMELFAYAGILSKKKKGNQNIYSINNILLLEYISIRERNALNFLISYIQKVLVDSGLWKDFNNFLSQPNKSLFSELKNKFELFTIQYTAINKETECRRIFTKILNPLAFAFNSYGTQRGELSKQKINYDQLMYNRINFRDLYTSKPKDISRNEYEPTILEKQKLEKYWKYNSNKARKYLRKFNDEFYNSVSEHKEDHDDGLATHIHHIFPEASYPNISGFIENLIALTPSQHLNKAHPSGNTREINRDYQHVLLISKTKNIEDNLSQEDIPKIYDFNRMKEVLAIGLNNFDINHISLMDFYKINSMINSYYK